MNILVAYGTNSSGTMVAGEVLCDMFVQQQHAAELKRADTVNEKDLRAADLVIFGSCSWERFEGEKKLEGQLQEHMYDLAQRLRGNIFPGKNFAVYGLGDSSFTQFCGAADRLVELVNQVGGKLVTDPLRIDGFFFHQDANEQRLRHWAVELTSKLGQPA